MKKTAILLLILNSILSYGQINPTLRDENLNPPPSPILQTIPVNEINVTQKPKKFIAAGCFSEGLAAIQCNDGRWGFIDKTGKLVIPAIYDNNGLIPSFKNGTSVVFLNKKMLIMNKLGNDIIPKGYTFFNEAGNEFLIVKSEDKFGVADYSGKIIIPALYSLILYNNSFGLFRVYQYGKVSFLDKEGKETFFSKYSYLEDGLPEEPIVARLNEKWGYIDLRGNEIVSFKYDGANVFSNGFAKVKLDEKWGFIDRSGKEIIALRYDKADSFSEELASVKINNKWGYINSSGEIIIPIIYDEVNDFSNGIAIVKVNDKWGLIDKSGKLVTPMKYDDITDCFKDAYNIYKDVVSNVGIYSVKINGKIGIINYKGQEITLFKYNEIMSFSNDRALVQLNNKYGFIDRNGNEVVPLIYDFAYPFFSEELTRVKKNGKSGFIDINGKEVIPLIYERAEQFSEGLASVIFKGQVLFINKKGKIIIKPIAPKI